MVRILLLSEKSSGFFAKKLLHFWEKACIIKRNGKIGEESCRVKNNEPYTLFAALSAIGQAAWCMLVPTALGVLAGKLLCGRFGWSRGVFLLFIIAGVLIGFYSMFTYIRKMMRLLDSSGRPPQKRR